MSIRDLQARGLALATMSLAMLGAACSSNHTMPTAPSSTTVTTRQYATVGGTVRASGTAPASSLKVSVAGTALVTVTDTSGRFMFQGVPAGQVALHFEGPDVDAQLVVGVVGVGATVDISVRVSGHDAVMEGPENDAASLHGTVESVAASSLRVSGRTVVTNAATRILGRSGETLTLSQIHVGDMVEVEGMTQADGSLLASSIKLDDSGDNNNAGEEVSLSGAIEAIAAPSLRVAGRMVVTNTSTRLLGHGDQAITFGQLTVGTLVEVEGRSQADGSILATKVQLEDAGDGGNDGGHDGGSGSSSH